MIKNLIDSVVEGNLDYLKILCRFEDNRRLFEKEKDIFLVLAVQFGHFHIVEYLVDIGADVYFRSCEALRLADTVQDEFVRLDLIKFLVQRMDPVYVIEKYPRYIGYIGREYSQIKMADKFGMFSND